MLTRRELAKRFGSPPQDADVACNASSRSPMEQYECRYYRRRFPGLRGSGMLLIIGHADTDMRFSDNNEPLSEQVCGAIARAN